MRKILLIFIITLSVFVEKSLMRRDDYSQPQQHDSIKIGGLFDDAQEAEFVFKYAVRKTSEQMFNATMRRLSADLRRVASGDELAAATKVCEMIESGALGILGPTSTESALHVRNVCDTKEIPLIEMRLDSWSKHVINLHPTPNDLARAFLDLISAFNWQGFTILYEDAPWLPLIDVIMRNYTADKFTVAVRQLDITANANYRPRLLHIKKSEDKNIVICCSIQKLPEILKQAQQVGLLSDEHNILITNLDMHTIDLEAYQYGGTNITGLRMIFPDDPNVKEIIADLNAFADESNVNYERGRHGNRFNQEEKTPEEVEYDWRQGLSAQKMLLSTALTYDAVMLFSRTMAGHRDISASNIRDCSSQDSMFINGTSIVNFLRTVDPFRGLSGEIRFGQFGNRSNFNLEVLELVSDGLKKIGTWNSQRGLQIRHDRVVAEINRNEIFKGKTLKILTVDNEPYGMRKQSSDQLIGNDQYEGYGIELIEKLALKLGFNYTFELQEDKKYGNKQSDESWDGMIGELMADRADLAITDLTITSDREEAADFTMPFMDLGIQILFQKPKKEDPDLFSFLQPFSYGVWACVIGCFFLVSFCLYIMGRMSPQEWDNPYPCIEEPEVLFNQFTLKNAIWFSVGAIFQQGSEIAPKAPSTRLVASIWWFFTLIMVSSYTANLAAFLTIENPSPIIRNVQELYEKGKDGKVTYGAKKGGSTYAFFRDAEDGSLYKKMYNYMEAHAKDVMMESNPAGLIKAKQEKYAFLMESSTIEYIEQRACEVAHVGNNLDEKSYGIAMKKGSLFRGPLDEAILQMQESGELSRMKTKWYEMKMNYLKKHLCSVVCRWREKRGGGACSSDDGGGGADKLSMKNVGGIFVTILIGSGIAMVLGSVRWIQYIKKIARKFQITFKEAFAGEFRFFRQFNTHVKPMRKDSATSDESVENLHESRDRSRTRSQSMAANKKEITRTSLKSLNNRIDRLDESLI